MKTVYRNMILIISYSRQLVSKYPVAVIKLLAYQHTNSTLHILLYIQHILVLLALANSDFMSRRVWSGFLLTDDRQFTAGWTLGYNDIQQSVNCGAVSLRMFITQAIGHHSVVWAWCVRRTVNIWESTKKPQKVTYCSGR